MMLVPLLLIGVIVYAVFKLNESNAGDSKTLKDDALGILNQRFARGEIDEPEYQQKKLLILKK